MRIKSQLTVALAVFMALTVAISAIPADDGVEGADGSNPIDLAEFIDRVVAAGYEYDGQGITVEWIPTSACTYSAHDTNTSDCLFAGSPEDREGDGNNPGRVQNGNAQYSIFQGQTDVSISNVNFVYAYAENDPEFTLCQQDRGAERTGTFGYDKARNAELQFLNSGDLTITNCNFDRVIVSPFGCYGETTINGCEFSDVYNAYTIKDVYSETATIEGCTFTHCSGGIYFEGDTTKGSYTIKGNTFEDMDSYAADGKENTRGLIQFSGKGDYSNSKIVIEENQYSGDTPVFCQLNPTITPSVLDAETIAKDNGFVGNLFTSDSKDVSNSEIYVDSESGDDDTGDGTQSNPFKTLTPALAQAKSGDTILVTGTLTSGIPAIDKPLTIKGLGEQRAVLSSNIKLPTATGTVKFVNFSFEGSTTLGVYGVIADSPGLDLVFEDCDFPKANNHTMYIVPAIHSLAISDCTFITTELVTSYLIWTSDIVELTIEDSVFNGNGNYRGAVHPGDGSASGTTVTVSGCTFNGFERGFNIAFTNENVQNNVTIDNNKFENISDITGDTAYDAEHVAAVYIHSDQKADTTTIQYSGNSVSGGSGRVFFSNNPTIPAWNLIDQETFTGNSLNGEPIDNMMEVCLDPWVAMVDNTGYATVAEALDAVATVTEKKITLLKDAGLSTKLTVTVEGLVLDLGGHTLTVADDYTPSTENPHLVSVENVSATIENGTLKTGSSNTHGLNLYGADVNLRDLTIDVTGSGGGFCAPLIVNSSDITLGGEMTFVGGTYYSINLDSRIDGVDKAGLATEEGTVLTFSKVGYGIYNEMKEGMTASIVYGADTSYHYDTTPFQLMVSANDSTVDDTGSSTPVDREENPLYDLTITVIPDYATITVSGHGQMTSGETIQLEGGRYSITISLDGYVTITDSIDLTGDMSRTYEMSEVTVSPPAGDDDDESLPPIIRPGGSGSSADDDTVTIVACAAAAAVAAILAVFLIYAYRKD